MHSGNTPSLELEKIFPGSADGALPLLAPMPFQLVSSVIPDYDLEHAL